jgi:hypothetical protein
MIVVIVVSVRTDNRRFASGKYGVFGLEIYGEDPRIKYVFGFIRDFLWVLPNQHGMPRWATNTSSLAR